METIDKVKEILCDQLGIDASQVTAEAGIFEDLGADSLDIVDVVMNLEEAFDTEIPDDAIESLKTVGDVARYIDEHTAAHEGDEE